MIRSLKRTFIIKLFNTPIVARRVVAGSLFHAAEALYPILLAHLERCFSAIADRVESRLHRRCELSHLLCAGESGVSVTKGLPALTTRLA